MIIHKLKKEDWGDFIKLEKSAFADNPEDDIITKEDFMKYVKTEGFFGGFLNGKLIGYLKLKIMGSYAHINRIGVKQEFQGKGFGFKLMEFAMKYFEEYKAIQIGLYVETHNKKAIHLYEKYNFEIVNESWHYIIDLDSFNEYIVPQLNLDHTQIREVLRSEIDDIVRTFSRVNKHELLTLLDTQDQGNNTDLHVLGLYENNELKSFARFSPKFSGCRPFYYTSLEYADIFIKKLEKYKVEERNYIRITFDDDKEFAILCAERGYNQHHHLYKMIRETET